MELCFSLVFLFSGRTRSELVRGSQKFAQRTTRVGRNSHSNTTRGLTTETLVRWQALFCALPSVRAIY